MGTFESPLMGHALAYLNKIRGVGAIKVNYLSPLCSNPYRVVVYTVAMHSLRSRRIPVTTKQKTELTFRPIFTDAWGAGAGVTIAC
jgi:hypothetical protein